MKVEVECTGQLNCHVHLIVSSSSLLLCPLILFVLDIMGIYVYFQVFVCVYIGIICRLGKAEMGKVNFCVTT